MQIPSLSLAHGPAMPFLGLGTYLLQGRTCEKILKEAYALGYRHFDTAMLYENHTAVGRALKSFDRQQVYLTSKFMPYHLDEYTVTEACDLCLKELDVDYLDLFLFHYPDRKRDMVAILTELASLIDTGKIKAMGISNFTVRHLADISPLQLPIAVNQVEFHPYLYQKDLYEACLKQHIHLSAYRPLGKGQLTEDPFISQIGEKYGKTASQIILRWLVELNVPPIVKTDNLDHLKENAAIFDFSLTQADRQLLSHLQQKPRFCQSEWSDFDYS